jgi:hypothetical protein
MRPEGGRPSGHLCASSPTIYMEDMNTTTPSVHLAYHAKPVVLFSLRKSAPAKQISCKLAMWIYDLHESSRWCFFLASYVPISDKIGHDRCEGADCWRKNRTSSPRAAHMTPRTVARRASQSDLLIDNGKMSNNKRSASEPMGLVLHAYLPIGWYEKAGSAGSKAAEVQICLKGSAISADGNVSTRINLGRLCD